MLQRAEAKLYGHGGYWRMWTAQQLHGPLNAALDLEFDGRESRLLAELVDEVRGRKRGFARKGVNREVPFGMGANLLDDLRDARGTFGV